MDIDKETLSKIITNWYKNEKECDWLESWTVDSIDFNEKENEAIVEGVVKRKMGKRWGDTVTLTYEKDLSEYANENDYIVNLYHLKGRENVETKKTLNGRLEEGKLIIIENKKKRE